MSKKTHRVRLVTHPLVAAIVTKLRDKQTYGETYRYYVRTISHYLIYEALSDLQLKKRAVTTQTNGVYTGHQLAETIRFFAVLREGIGMLESAMQTIPNAQFDLIGLKRNDEDPFASPAVMYLDGFKHIDASVSRIVIMDQMFATGGTLMVALDSLINKHNYKGVVDIISIIATQDGVERVLSSFPRVRITCAGLDTKLTDKGYIFPGLGDAADKYFNTYELDHNHTI